MSLESAIVKRSKTFVGLNALLNGRFYFQRAPQNAVLPYCVFSFVSALPISEMVTDTDILQSRIQINTYAATGDELIDISTQLHGAYIRWSMLEPDPITQVLDTDLLSIEELYGDDETVYGRTHDIEFSYRM